MGFFSSAWKGIKGAVKSVARSVKKVAKTVAHAIPGGKQLWEFGTKIGKGIEKGIGWIGKKLGPIGTMALSFVLPFAAPLFAAMWTGFGAAAAGMAATGGAITSALGTVGSAIFNGANFVGGTLGAMGKAIAEGVSQLGQGNLGAAGNAFTSNMKSAFTGEAGKAAITKAIGAIPAGQVPLTEGVTSGGSYFAENAKFKAPDTSFGMKDVKGNSMFPDGIDINSGAKTGTNYFAENAKFKAPGITETVAPKTGLLRKGIDTAKDLLDTFGPTGGQGGGGEPVDESGYDQGLQAHTISAAGQVDPIKAVTQGNDLYSQIIASANRGTV